MFISKFKLLGALAFHFARGNYQNISSKSMFSVIGVILYFITPIDLIPDFLPGIGYLDDITLIAWLFNSISSELDKFSIWYKSYSNAEIIQFSEIEDKP